MKSFVWILFSLLCSCIGGRVFADIPAERVQRAAELHLPLPTCDAEQPLWVLSPTFGTPGIDVGDVKPEARVALIQPVDGTTLPAPGMVELVAEATNPEGIFDAVEFTANGEVIGTSHFEFCPPCPVEPCPLRPCILPPIGVTLTHHLLWLNPAPGNYALQARALTADGAAVVSAPVQLSVLLPHHSSLTFVSPADGSIWNTPGEVPLEVTAVDPVGEIRRVEFFADEQWIGVSEILTRDVEIPGRPRMHRLSWTNPPAGKHALQARAVDRSGQKVVSEGRRIVMVGDLAAPVVWVEALDSAAVEGGRLDDGSPDSVRFRVHRLGDLQRDLHVFFHLAGTAELGVDYPVPAATLRLAPGQLDVDLVVEPLDDRLSEGKESLVLVLDPSPVMSPMGTYRIDPDRGSAQAVIQDDEPGFAFQSPEPGDVIPLGVPIIIRVRVTWSPDYVSHVEFLSDGKKIGDSVVNFFQAPPPGTPIQHEFVWTGAPVGGHHFTVQTRLADGTVAGSAEARDIRVGNGNVSDIPVVTVETARKYALEGDRFNRGEIVLQRTGDLSTDLQVNFGLTGAAVRGADYRLVLNPCDDCAMPDREIDGDFIVIPAGQADAKLGVVAVFDGMLQGVEPVLEDVNLQVYTPPVPAMVGAKPSYVAGLPDHATVQVVDRQHPGEAEITLISPEQGAVLQPVGPNLIQALAVDPKGSFRRMEFTANGNQIGVSEIMTDDVDIPGRLRTHSLVWSPIDPARSGPNELMALGKDSSGREVRSSPVSIIVFGKFPRLPVITLARGKSPASERGDLKSRLGGFVLTREGADVSLPLTVFVEVGGTATSGLDYQWHPEGGVDGVEGQSSLPIPGSFLPVVFAPRTAEATVNFMATTDTLIEGEETVSLRLIEPPVLAAQLPGSPALPVTYRIGDPMAAEVVIEDGNLDLPSISLTQPVGGSQFQVGDVVSLVATAVRPNAGVESIQFLVDGSVIGTVNYCCDVCDCAPAPRGRPFTARFDWRPTTPGSHVLTARTFLEANLALESPPVVVQVGDAPAGSLVIVSPVDGSKFSNGETITIEAVGQDSTALVSTVEFFANGEKIGESCFLCVVDGIFPPGTPIHNQITWKPSKPGRYVLTAIGQFGFGLDRRVASAPVTVEVGAVAAGISWVSPTEGAEFAKGKPILLEVQAVDPTGLFFQVEFFDRDVWIGTSEYSCPTCRLAPGAVIPHHLEWQGATVGQHVLTARAAGPNGTWVISPPRHVSVLSDPLPGSFVTRVLPKTYEAGKAFTVRLEARPESSVAAYVVEEQPPYALPAPGPTWRVGWISGDGVFDPLTGRVKFGPYFDHEARTLVYEVVPDFVAESAWFDGVGVADGRTSAIGGDRELRVSFRHPADQQPPDDAINAEELTAYAAAWKREQTWPTGPHPIPMDYVTRAALLWKGGERYAYDPRSGAPPFCWVLPANATPSVDGSLPAPPLAGMALRQSEVQSDGSMRVTLRVTPAPGARAFAIEEQLPGIGSVSAITAGGEVSSSGSRILRWGPFDAGALPLLSYVLSGTDPGTGPKGIVSFDGQSVLVRDDGEKPDTSEERLVWVDSLQDGSRQICLKAGGLPQGALYELQVSADLRVWTPVGVFSSGQAAGFARDAGAAETAVRFYRAVPAH